MKNLLNMMFATDNNWILLVVLGVLIVALLVGSFIMQKRNKKKADETKASMKIGDVIVTIGGIKGTVCAINDQDDTIDVKTGEGTVITFFKGAIQAINPQMPVTKVAAAAAEPIAEKVEEEVREEKEEVEAEEDKDDTVGH